MNKTAAAALPRHTDVLDSSSIGQIRATLQSTPLMFHAFRYRGTQLIYDIATGSLLEPDSGTYAVLESIQAGESDAALLARLDTIGARASLATIASELTSLRNLGLFEPIRETSTPEERRMLVDSLLSHHPRKLMLLVQTNCNLKCTYCYEVKSGFHTSSAKKSMDLETAKRSVDDLVRRSGGRPNLQVTFFGGEPLINFELVQEVVAYCKSIAESTRKNFGYAITSNGVLLTDAIIAFLVREQFTVMISLDGRPEGADKARVDLGGRGVAAKATANAQKLVNAQVAANQRPALIRATLSHDNHDTRATEQYFAEAGFARTMIGASTGRAHEKGPADLTADDVREMQEASEAAIEEYVRWAEGRGARPALSGPEKGLEYLREKLDKNTHGSRVGCGVGRNMLAYTADGRFYPCHRYAGEAAYELGSLDRGLDEQRLRQYYDDVLDVFDHHCANCWARVLCGGQCAHYNSRPDGRVGPPDVESCDSIRLGMERSLWLLSFVEKRGITLGQYLPEPEESAEQD
jgi:uncharacterized protein